MKLTIRKTFLLGAVVGDILAIVVGIILLLPFPFSHGLHLELITIGAWLCPFYMLMFMTVVHSMGAVIAISLVGNAVLYGGIAVLVRLVCLLLRIGVGSTDGPGLRHT
jgi:hypothetical protein